MKIDLTKEEVEKVIIMIEGSQIQVAYAEEVIKILQKFKDAKD